MKKILILSVLLCISLYGFEMRGLEAINVKTKQKVNLYPIECDNGYQAFVWQGNKKFFTFHGESFINVKYAKKELCKPTRTRVLKNALICKSKSKLEYIYAHGIKNIAKNNQHFKDCYSVKKMMHVKKLALHTNKEFNRNYYKVAYKGDIFYVNTKEVLVDKTKPKQYKKKRKTYKKKHKVKQKKHIKKYKSQQKKKIKKRQVEKRNVQKKNIKKESNIVEDTDTMPRPSDNYVYRCVLTFGEDTLWVEHSTRAGAVKLALNECVDEVEQTQSCLISECYKLRVE